MTGRFPPTGEDGGVIFSGANSPLIGGGVLPKSDVAPAAALPASEVRKNFRRVQSPIHAPLANSAGPHLMFETHSLRRLFNRSFNDLLDDNALLDDDALLDVDALLDDDAQEFFLTDFYVV
jgi:hypothetical protein